jgi:hypothetical protein
MTALPDGVRYLPEYLDRKGQEALVDEIRQVVTEAPLYVPEMPRTGKPMSVRMTNCGPPRLGDGQRARLSLPGLPSRDRLAVARDSVTASGTVGESRRLPQAAGGVPSQLLRQSGTHGSASGQGRNGSYRPRSLYLARKHLSLPDRRNGTQRTYALIPPDERRRARPRRSGASLLPRRGPGLPGNLNIAEERRTHQFDLETGQSLIRACAVRPSRPGGSSLSAG